MISQDMLGISAFVFVSMAFFLFGYNKKLFTLLCSGIILGHALLTLQLTNDTFCWVESVLLMMGIGLYWFGLLILRVMIARSLSLHILLNLSSEEPAKHISEEINSRIAEISHYRLGKQQGDTLCLTPFGHFISFIVAFIYAVIGIKR